MIARIKANSEHMCPVCGKYEFPYDGSFDTCEVCGWVDDPIQLENPDEDRCANHERLNEYRAKWKSAGDLSGGMKRTREYILEGKKMIRKMTDEEAEKFCDERCTFLDYKSKDEYIEDIITCLVYSSWQYTEEQAMKQVQERMVWVERYYEQKEPADDAAAEIGYCCG